MAKMKVHELAKEVDRKSKELIDFLQAKGYEVKVAQSSIEDEAIALVGRPRPCETAVWPFGQTGRRRFGKGACHSGGKAKAR